MNEQRAFAALMGPGFSVIGVLPALIASAIGTPSADWLIEFAGVVAILNLFNLMPVEPLDGGVVLRLMLSRLFGSRTHLAMMVSSGLIAFAGIYLASPVILILGLVAAFANLKPRHVSAQSVPLNGQEPVWIMSGFVLIGTAHALGLVTFFDQG